MNIGIINPGAMGISIAASAINSGNKLYWVATGRSTASQQRAAEHHLRDAGDLAELCARCEMIISVCPPHAAEEVAQSIADQNFQGYYLDANAISPQRAKRIATLLESNGAIFVDGSIIGGPAWTKDATILYLAGLHAEPVADRFQAGPLATKIISNEIGQASALKMCYAAYSKGTTALLSAILTAAQALDVADELQTQWQHDQSDLGEQAARRTQRVTAKAWRYTGEMQEIADTFASIGLPSGFHEAAADMYTRMAHFKDAPKEPDLATVLAALLNPTELS